MDSPAVVVAMVILFVWVALEMVGLFGARFGGHDLGLRSRLQRKRNAKQH